MRETLRLQWIDGADPDAGVGVFEGYLDDLLGPMKHQGMLKATEEMIVPEGRGIDYDTGPGGIPFYKLDCGAAYPWLVSTAEIDGALANAEADPDPPRFPLGRPYDDRETDEVGLAWRTFAWRERWRAWIAFLRGAVEHGGFRAGWFEIDLQDDLDRLVK